MVKLLPVLLTTFCLHHLVACRRLSDDIENDISPIGAAAPYDFRILNYVRITQPPISPMVSRKIGQHLELHCEAMGSPPPTIQWYKDNMKITENESFDDNIINRTPSIAKVSSRLVINHVLVRHQGFYHCEADNGDHIDKAGTNLVVPNAHGREMNLTELIKLKFVGSHHQPRVTFWASAYMDVIGADVILPCKHVGNPKPDVLWFDINNKEIENDERFSILQEGELKIKSINWEDMGMYTCMVRNSVGQDAIETFLYPMQQSN
ncbi:hypothetical protein ABEB36_006452 [Hypothenemus hampei]|uniref:Ig-like domain-containing protein n=1 Tax=Hypothenemus hampei TaxID=57062 RepID=A0ABD1ER30_HYPHA